MQPLVEKQGSLQVRQKKENNLITKTLFNFFSGFIASALTIIFSVHPALSMATDGTHSIDDYIGLSYEDSSFDAACAVEELGGALSGVLVSPKIVLSAAHGFENLFKNLPDNIKKNSNICIIPTKDINVYFKNKDRFSNINIQKIKVESILLDPRYFEGNGYKSREGKFDFCFLILKTQPNGIQPAKIFRSKVIPNNALITVVTYGTSDQLFQSLSPLRRAFRLYERDTYFGGVNDTLNDSRYLQECSLYFKPSLLTKQPLSTQSEQEIRSYEATQNWMMDNKKPYALALPGTSGSPVFIEIINKGIRQFYLFGLVSSFAHITGTFVKQYPQYEASYILNNRDKSLNQYHTIFSLPYKTVSMTPVFSNFSDSDDGWTHIQSNFRKKIKTKTTPIKKNAIDPMSNKAYTIDPIFLKLLTIAEDFVSK